MVERMRISHVHPLLVSKDTCTCFVFVFGLIVIHTSFKVKKVKYALNYLQVHSLSSCLFYIPMWDFIIVIMKYFDCDLTYNEHENTSKYKCTCVKLQVFKI